METWCKCTIGLVALSVILTALCLGFVDYPREHKRSTDAVNLIIDAAWLIWGLLVVFK